MKKNPLSKILVLLLVVTMVVTALPMNYLANSGYDDSKRQSLACWA
jgi:hypothetical protein